MLEVIVVGSGAAGVAAAWELTLRGLRPIVLDVGQVEEQATPRVEENLYDYRRRRDSFDLHIGADYRGLAGVLSREPSIAKLNAPRMAFVTRGAAELGPLSQQDFQAIQSFALGGLGNAWGAGLYRWIAADLQDFPVTLAQLAPYFAKLTQEIGISGADDDLTEFFGDPSGLQPPLRLSRNAERVWRAYERRRSQLHARRIYLGRPRAGVLSQPKDGRPACDYSNLEFWQSQPYVYSPALTLRRLIRTGQVDYRPGLLVQRWRETAGGVTAVARDLDTGAEVEVHGQRLLLAAGAINTARLALQSAGDTAVTLPLLENPVLQIPVVLPAAVGQALDTHVFGLVQLNLVCEDPVYQTLLQGSLIELTAPLRSEFFSRFPLAARGNLALIRWMLPAMLMLQWYYPASVQRPAELSLLPDGRLHITGHPFTPDRRSLSALFSSLGSLGLWTHPALIQQPVTGHAIHYAGTLPMRRQPGPYQSYPDGRLYGSQRVFVADSASFSTLPAKNMSLGMMANAMRIAGLAAL